MAGYQNPIGVAEWKNQIANALPEELRSSLPSIEEMLPADIYLLDFMNHEAEVSPTFPIYDIILISIRMEFFRAESTGFNGLFPQPLKHQKNIRGR